MFESTRTLNIKFSSTFINYIALHLLTRKKTLETGNKFRFSVRVTPKSVFTIFNNWIHFIWIVKPRLNIYYMNKSAIKKNQFNFHRLFGTINWALVHVCPRVDNVLLSQQHWPLSHNSTFDQFPIFQWLSQRRCENESICRFLANVYGSLSGKLRL